MPVIVTGAAGFIGRHVVAAMRQRGSEVVGIDRRRWEPAAGEVAIVADLAAPNPRVDRMLARAAGVVHLAGCPGVRDRRPDIGVRRWRDNVLAGERVLEAVPSSVPVVVASSSSVYGGAGHSAGPRPCREDDELRPRGGYARSKWMLERRCAARAAHGGLVGVARPFTVAGEGQRTDMAISMWIAALRSGRHVRMFGSGARRRDITDARDIAEALVRMLERRVAGTVNLGTGQTHRLDHVLATVARECGVEPRVTFEPVAPDDVAATRADVGRCADLLGFVPVTDLPSLVARQVAATPAVAPPLVDDAAWLRPASRRAGRERSRPMEPLVR